MKKMLVVVFFAPLIAMAQYGGGKAPTNQPLPGADPASKPVASGTSATPSHDLVDSLAPPSCKKPVYVNSVRKADDNNADFSEKFSAYQDCVKAYVETQNSLATAHINAANAAVEDTNNFIKDLNEKQKK